MVNNGLLDPIPLWLLFPLGCLVILACCEIGFRIGRRSKLHSGSAPGPSVTVPVGAALGFVSFMLAFTFSSAAHRFEERRDVLIEDANAIETTYMRTRLLAEPEGASIRSLLKEYVDIRVQVGSVDNAVLVRTRELQDQIWLLATAAVKKSPSPVTAVFIQSLNEMIDINNKRIAIVFYHRIVNWIWLALFLLMVIGVGSMGYQSGLNSKERSPASIAIALGFTIVMVATAALDRPGAAIFQVDQSPMLTLQEHIAHDQ